MDSGWWWERRVSTSRRSSTSWPHAVVLECALGLGTGAPTAEAAEHTAHGGASHGHHGGGHGHHGGEPAGQQAEPGPDAPVGGQQCAMVMACGLVMMRAGGAAAAEAAPEKDARVAARPMAAPIAVDLGAETPPPRLNA